jgi:cobalt-zinc-cadmium efflux system outer membrane protein
VSARAQIVLTLEGTIARARAQAGEVQIARARVAETEATLLDASARFRDNPIIEASAGPRVGAGQRSTDIHVGLLQQFETGGQRQARMASARATIERQNAEVEQTARGVVVESASAFLDGLAAMERLQLAESSDSVARSLLNLTERRFALGDIAALDVNLARLYVARSAAALLAARADLTAAVGRLRGLLRIPAVDAIDLRGSLDLPAPPALDRLEALIDQRPEFAVLRAELRESEAQTQLGRALSRPDLGLLVAYQKEAEDTIVRGGLTITLPAFQRGQGTLAAGLARANRARVETEVRREGIHTELRAAYGEYEQRAALKTALERETGPTLADNDSLATRSYEAGEMNLIDLLLVRREAIEIRQSVIDRRLEAARSRLAVDVIAGVVR